MEKWAGTADTAHWLSRRRREQKCKGSLLHYCSHHQAYRVSPLTHHHLGKFRKREERKSSCHKMNLVGEVGNGGAGLPGLGCRSGLDGGAGLDGLAE